MNVIGLTTGVSHVLKRLETEEGVVKEIVVEQKTNLQSVPLLLPVCGKISLEESMIKGSSSQTSLRKEKGSSLPMLLLEEEICYTLMKKKKKSMMNLFDKQDDDVDDDAPNNRPMAMSSE